jgi:hypothetical protein
VFGAVRAKTGDGDSEWRFTGELIEFPETDVRLLAASRRETLHRLAVTLLGLSEESLDAILGAACRIRHLESLPTPD